MERKRAHRKSNPNNSNYKRACCAPGCNHARVNNRQVCSLYGFPNAMPFRSLWLSALEVHASKKYREKLQSMPFGHLFLCSCHFERPPDPKSRRPDLKYVVPTLFQEPASDPDGEWGDSDGEPLPLTHLSSLTESPSIERPVGVSDVPAESIPHALYNELVEQAKGTIDQQGAMSPQGALGELGAIGSSQAAFKDNVGILRNMVTKGSYPTHHKVASEQENTIKASPANTSAGQQAIKQEPMDTDIEPGQIVSNPSRNSPALNVIQQLQNTGELNSAVNGHSVLQQLITPHQGTPGAPDINRKKPTARKSTTKLPKQHTDNATWETAYDFGDQYAHVNSPVASGTASNVPYPGNGLTWETAYDFGDQASYAVSQVNGTSKVTVEPDPKRGFVKMEPLDYNDGNGCSTGTDNNTFQQEQNARDQIVAAAHIPSKPLEGASRRKQKPKKARIRENNIEYLGGMNDYTVESLSISKEGSKQENGDIRPVAGSSIDSAMGSKETHSNGLPTVDVMADEGRKDDRQTDSLQHGAAALQPGIGDGLGISHELHSQFNTSETPNSSLVGDIIPSQDVMDTSPTDDPFRMLEKTLYKSLTGSSKLDGEESVEHSNNFSALHEYPPASNSTTDSLLQVNKFDNVQSKPVPVPSSEAKESFNLIKQLVASNSTEERKSIAGVQDDSGMNQREKRSNAGRRLLDIISRLKTNTSDNESEGDPMDKTGQDETFDPYNDPAGFYLRDNDGKSDSDSESEKKHKRKDKRLVKKICKNTPVSENPVSNTAQENLKRGSASLLLDNKLEQNPMDQNVTLRSILSNQAPLGTQGTSYQTQGFGQAASTQLMVRSVPSLLQNNVTPLKENKVQQEMVHIKQLLLSSDGKSPRTENMADTGGSTNNSVDQPLNKLREKKAVSYEEPPDKVDSESSNDDATVLSNLLKQREDLTEARLLHDQSNRRNEQAANANSSSLLQSMLQSPNVKSHPYSTKYFPEPAAPPKPSPPPAPPAAPPLDTTFSSLLRSMVLQREKSSPAPPSRPLSWSAPQPTKPSVYIDRALDETSPSSHSNTPFQSLVNQAVDSSYSKPPRGATGRGSRAPRSRKFGPGSRKRSAPYDLDPLTGKPSIPNSPRGSGRGRGRGRGRRKQIKEDVQRESPYPIQISRVESLQGTDINWEKSSSVPDQSKEQQGDPSSTVSIKMEYEVTEDEESSGYKQADLLQQYEQTEQAETFLSQEAQDFEQEYVDMDSLGQYNLVMSEEEVEIPDNEVADQESRNQGSVEDEDSGPAWNVQLAELASEDPADPPTLEKEGHMEEISETEKQEDCSMSPAGTVGITQALENNTEMVEEEETELRVGITQASEDDAEMMDEEETDLVDHVDIPVEKDRPDLQKHGDEMDPADDERHDNVQWQTDAAELMEEEETELIDHVDIPVEKDRPDLQKHGDEMDPADDERHDDVQQQTDAVARDEQSQSDERNSIAGSDNQQDSFIFHKHGNEMVPPDDDERHDNVQQQTDAVTRDEESLSHERNSIPESDIQEDHSPSSCTNSNQGFCESVGPNLDGAVLDTESDTHQQDLLTEHTSSVSSVTGDLEGTGTCIPTVETDSSSQDALT